MLKEVAMPNNVNNDVNTKVDQLIEGGGGTSIFKVSLFLFWGNILWEESLNNLLDQKTSGTCASCLHLERANDFAILLWFDVDREHSAPRCSPN